MPRKLFAIKWLKKRQESSQNDWNALAFSHTASAFWLIVCRGIRMSNLPGCTQTIAHGATCSFEKVVTNVSEMEVPRHGVP